MGEMLRSEDFCGVILAGGQSLRMGRDKALLEIDGQPLVRRLANLLAGITGEVILSAGQPERYAFLGLPVIHDLFPGQGPLAGLHAAMRHSRRPVFILLACDLPQVHSGLLECLIRHSEGSDAVVPLTSDGRIHPLCGLYRRTCLPAAEHYLGQNLNRLRLFLQDPSLRVRWVKAGEGRFSDPDLWNLNYPCQLTDYLRRTAPA